MAKNPSTDLTEEGSITFWIKKQENPAFSDPESNIKFTENKDVGGVHVSFLKEGTYLRVVLENLKYGETTIVADIEDLLDEDMMVALTWSKRNAKLYLNDKLVKESHLSERDANIKTIVTDEARELMQKVDVEEEEVFQTVNDRDRGLLISGSPLRVGAIHWFVEKVVLVSAHVCESRWFGNKLKLDEVRADLVLRLEDELPAGRISRDMHFQDILTVIAQSFGLPLATTKDGEGKKIHIESEWDGTINIPHPDQTYFLQGTFSREENKCHYVWAFSPEKYMRWAEDNIEGRSEQREGQF